jgi:hypothetical protein
MSSEEEGPVAWLRRQAQSELAVANLGISTRAEGPLHVIADCEAKLALIDLCTRVISDDEGHEYYSDGWSGLAVARLTLSFLAAGYRHREGYREEDWRS